MVFVCIRVLLCFVCQIVCVVDQFGKAVHIRDLYFVWLGVGFAAGIIHVGGMKVCFWLRGLFMHIHGVMFVCIRVLFCFVCQVVCVVGQLGKAMHLRELYFVWAWVLPQVSFTLEE